MNGPDRVTAILDFLELWFERLSFFLFGAFAATCFLVWSLTP